MAFDANFIACLYEPADLVEVRLLPKVRSHFSRAEHLSELDAILDGENAAGLDVFVGVNPRMREGGKAADVLLARCVFVDIDRCEPDEANERIERAGLPKPTCFVSSGHGAHAYWRLTTAITRSDEWKCVMKSLIQRLDSDSAVSGWPQIMRLPGFVNHKTPPADCRVIEANPGRRYDLHALVSVTVEHVAERQNDICFSASLPLCVSATPDEIIAKTLPKQVGQRNASVFDLARGLKFDAGLSNRSLPELKPIVRKWHELALPMIGTKPFDDTWADFIRGWECAAIPLAAAPVTGALAKARQDAENGCLPACAEQYDSGPVRLLVGTCRYLAEMRPDRVFFLSSHDIGKRLETSPVQAWRWLNMLCADDVLRRVDRGNSRRAARFKWLAEDTAGVAERGKGGGRDA